MNNKMTTVSLFCGAGGESAGKFRAFDSLGMHPAVAHAVNHWELAVQVHGRNFPKVQVHREDITQVTAEDLGLKRIDLLWASPSCVHHSRARGGKPRDDQERSHAHEVVERWLKVADVRVFLMENVTEFADWGPLHTTHSPGCWKARHVRRIRNWRVPRLWPRSVPQQCAKGCHHHQPDKARKGEFFRAFLGDLKGLGYAVEWRVLCAADYGDPTKRHRLFLQAVKDGRPITWPAPTHRDPKAQRDLFDADLPAWRTAAECIDWSMPVRSIFDRKKPLADKTMRRIAHGVDKFVVHPKAGTDRFILNLTHGGRVEDVRRPMNTVTTAKRGEKALVAAQMVNLRGTADQQLQASSSGADEPLKAITAGGIHAGLAVASLIQYHDETSEAARVDGLREPLATVDTSNRYGLVEAFVIKHNTGVIGNHPEQPLGTITGIDHHGVVAATLINTRNGEREGQAPRVADIQEPMGTVTAQGSQGAIVEAQLAQQPLDEATLKKGYRVAAFMMQYFGTDNFSSPGDPLTTATAKARHALVYVIIDGDTYIIVDIGMRMLRPRELARAMGFPDTFLFENVEGREMTIEAQVKMIGNACPVGTVSALILNVIEPRLDEYRDDAA